MQISSHCNDQPAFAARLHDLHEEAGDIRRRLSFVASRFRDTAEVDADLMAALKTRTALLLHHTLAFTRELQGR
jgi:hypothetical protein